MTNSSSFPLRLQHPPLDHAIIKPEFVP